MDRLLGMQVFTRVVEMKSFSRAADSLNLPAASATTIIKNLEAHLNVRLLQRTTRRLNLTAEGADYYERCVRILAEVDESEAAVAHRGKGPRGKLRIDMPTSVGRCLVLPKIDEFRQQYPDIELMFGFSDRPVDLIEDGVDCAIRIGALEDSSLVARRLSSLHKITVASPSYLATYGVPQEPDDLQRHHAIQYFSTRSGRLYDMNFVNGKRTEEVRVPGALAVNDADASVMCAVQGMGLVQAFTYMLMPYMQTGQLVEVMPEWRPRPKPISVVYPHNRHLAPKIRVFVEWLATFFERCPLLSSGTIEEGYCPVTAGEAERPLQELARGATEKAVPAVFAPTAQAPVLAAGAERASEVLGAL
ncbi:transcriptional regulator, LysR family [Chitinasiproducens palmae]|uniref:Transcriptional regulator, LysR family n=1 Tax=Chitinasiproducens palmae TaxID=1770053 RepID=A0A1H2PU01_9BURK|nr:LysR family transcriptional regulator [Chitinasiproducens palmae]SDV50648.1 transcriptional regulator, LysR family [Chitinasiproducens palmae]